MMQPDATPSSALVALTRQAEGLWQAVAPVLPAFSVEVLPHIDSTNTELMRRARAGEHAPTLLVALAQTAGRGRRGKSWFSAPGDSLTFSLGLPLHPTDWSGLSLAVGVSLAESIGPRVRLKWPNDLWWRQRKLGGILVETATTGDRRYAVVGIGLNVATPVLPPQTTPDHEPGGVPPVGLRDLGDEHANDDAGQWLARVVPPLVRDLLAFEQGGFAAFGERYARRDALRGLAVRLSDGQEGIAQGTGPDGALLLDTPQGVRSITSAEVSVRPC